jgi:hypothetical protein
MYKTVVIGLKSQLMEIVAIVMSVNTPKCFRVSLDRSVAQPWISESGCSKAIACGHRAAWRAAPRLLHSTNLNNDGDMFKICILDIELFL